MEIFRFFPSDTKKFRNGNAMFGTVVDHTLRVISIRGLAYLATARSSEMLTNSPRKRRKLLKLK